MNEGGTPYSPKRLKTTRWGTRAAAWALVAALLIPMLNWARVYAAETPEGGLCVHHPAHTPDCGFVEASLGSPCSLSPDTGLPEDQVYTPGSDALPEHVHDETCGYAPAQEGHPCTYLCPYCVSGWEWNNPEEMLAWNEDAKLWGLGLPGASESMPVTREMLAELLPQSATVSTLDGKKSEQALAWDLSAVPETGAAQGRFSVSASLPEPFALTGSAPTLSVLVEVGEGEVLASNRALNDCSFRAQPGTTVTKNDDGTWSMDVYVLSNATSAQLKEVVPSVLPQLIYGRGYSDASDGGFTYDPNGPSVPSGEPSKWGTLEIAWKTIPDDMRIGQVYSLKPSAKSSAYNWIINANYGDGELLLNVALHPIDVNQHTVPAANPDATVNLFDYWVKTENPTVATNGDILVKSDLHIHEEGDTGELAKTATNYSTVTDWNLGINRNHLLLFGDGMIHSGLWNKGAGSNCRYGQLYAGMEGIVKNVLAEDGYPELNLENADKILTSDKTSPEIVTVPGPDDTDVTIAKYQLIKDYALTGDHDGEIDYDGNNTPAGAYSSDNIQNLNQTVIETWGGNIDTDTESLQYLFDPTVSHPNKTSYTDVKGLFQIDDEGYYYL